MRRVVRSFVWGTLILFGYSNPVAAERVALVIGNNEYSNVAKLQKAVNDAKAIGEALEGKGFAVQRALNLSRREMNRQLQIFASRLDAGDEALFFFAGHGVEIAGRNYLLPTDIPSASPGQETFVKAEAVPVDQILDIMRSRGTRVSILVLDACRDNPFPKSGTRSLGSSRGLARMPAPEGTFIMYSAGVGQTALDRLSDSDPHPNSVFTRSLIPLFGQPGLSLVQTARTVRRDVQELAKTVLHDQRPAYYDEVTGDFFFTGSRASPTPTLTARPSSAAKQARVTIHECDRLAASVYDEGGIVEGVKWGDLVADRALIACRSALAKYPDETRFQYQLGRVLDKHEYYAEALTHYRKAADAGYAAAMYNLGSMYDYGRGLEGDQYEATRWYRKSADKGYVVAMAKVGLRYEDGRGVSKDLREAVRWYRKAADAGYAGAMTNLGYMYGNGRGVGADLNEAVRWYRKAAENGDAVAMSTLGAMYKIGEGVDKDDRMAVRWYRKAANKGSASGMYFLAVMYDTGEGVAKDSKEALKWYRKAAELKDPAASLALAGAYTSGKAVAKDYRAAAGNMIDALKAGFGPAVKRMTTNSGPWGNAFRQELQRLMKEEGVYSGAIDGQFGPGTKQAIKALAKQ